MFLLTLETMNFSATTSFHQSVLKAWPLVFNIARDAQQHLSVVEEPLLSNPMIQTVQTCFVRAGLTTLESFRVDGSWRTVADLGGETGVRSSRLLQKVLDEVTSPLPENNMLVKEQRL